MHETLTIENGRLRYESSGTNIGKYLVRRDEDTIGPPASHYVIDVILIETLEGILQIDYTRHAHSSVEFSKGQGKILSIIQFHVIFILFRCNFGRQTANHQTHGPLTYAIHVTRLSVQRLRTLQQKKEAQAKSARRDIALLLERGKLESARVKVEASKSATKFDGNVHTDSRLPLTTTVDRTNTILIVINEDINLELLELLELYCELLIARFGLLDQR